MSFGVAANCVMCKVLGSQVFLNAKKERICAACIQKEYDNAVINVEKSFDGMFKLDQQIKALEEKLAAFEVKIEGVEAVIEPEIVVEDKEVVNG